MNEMRIFDGIQTINYSVNNPVFNVIISTSRPENPQENTIWINGTGNNWVYSVVKPDDENATGWIWIQSGLECPEDIQILPSNKKNNKIYAYPIKAYTNIGGTNWARCDIEFFVNGKWVSLSGGLIIDESKTIITTEHWLAGAEENYPVPSLDNSGKFTFNEAHINNVTEKYGIDAWMICTKIDLSKLKPTKLTVQWNKLSLKDNYSSSDNKKMPTVSIRLFNYDPTTGKWVHGTNNTKIIIEKLATEGGGSTYDITSYSTAMNSYPYIGIYITRGSSISGVIVPFVNFELT